MQCGNIASRTNGAGCTYIYIYGIRTYHIYIHIYNYVYIYRQFSVFTTSVGLAALTTTTHTQIVSSYKGWKMTLPSVETETALVKLTTVGSPIYSHETNLIMRSTPMWSTVIRSTFYKINCYEVNFNKSTLALHHTNSFTLEYI